MGKLTKKQTDDLLRILQDISRAKSFINSPGIAICRVEDAATTTRHYIRANLTPWPDLPESLLPIMKEAGSEWCLADNANRSLLRFINANSDYVNLSVTPNS